MQFLPGHRTPVFNGITSHRASRPKTPFAKRLKRLEAFEAFNGRFRDECLNENLFRHLAHAR